jgi:hypothetical protein
MPSTDGNFWKSDESVFLALDGGKEIAEWFGFVPSFHDATLSGLELSNGGGIISLKAFRMTSEIDANGYFVLDRHALVDITLNGITGISLKGDANSVIQDFGVRRLAAESGSWGTIPGPDVGDIELCWESSWGLEGVIYASSVGFRLRPL